MRRFNPNIMAKTFDAACRTEKIQYVRLYASLVYKNKIVAMKPNVTKSHPFQKKYTRKEDAIFLHAENNCIVTAFRQGFTAKDLSLCSIYIARAAIFKDDTFSYAEAKPCTGCQSCLAAFEVRDVFYTTRHGVECL